LFGGGGGEEEEEDADLFGSLSLDNDASSDVARGAATLENESGKETTVDLMSQLLVGETTAVEPVSSAVAAVTCKRSRSGLLESKSIEGSGGSSGGLFDEIDSHQEAEEERWRRQQQLKQQAGRQIGLSNPGFNKLLRYSTSDPKDLASRHLAEMLERLKVSLEFIGDTLAERYSGSSEAIRSGIEALQDCIASQLLQQTCEGASQRVNSITKSFTPSQERNWLVYLMRCSGQTLTSIAEEQEPPLSRERIRQMEGKVSKIVGFNSVNLAEQVREYQEEQELT
jgi:hypothetical protein